VNGELLFKDREKEVLRKMIWQVADFSGVDVLTYCIMGNHFHVLVRVSSGRAVSNKELLRRFKLLYPKPTKHQEATVEGMERTLNAGGEEADLVCRKLLARMSDVSEFMKAIKQRFSVWYNRSHSRYGTLWAERFKSVLVEGKGNPLQTMAAYIDLNPVRAGIVDDPKDYRFCGYSEAVAGDSSAKTGLRAIWAAYADGSLRGRSSMEDALKMHRQLIFGKRSAEPGLPAVKREKTLKILEQRDAFLPRAELLRCRVRYFTDGAIPGSAEYVRGFSAIWQLERGRKYPPKANPMIGTDWGDLSVIQGLRRHIFG
jgi:REP element-mobilizing transposase RayT